jgi:FAD/FMN-containing dehydrogenase
LVKCQFEAMAANPGRKGIVVYVGSSEDISTVLKLTQEYAVSFSVCGGKHSSSGASSSTGGLVIDLGKMRNVEVNTANKTVKAQGGCIWKDVDEAAAEHGLAMVGGTVNHTGVGGL